VSLARSASSQLEILPTLARQRAPLAEPAAQLELLADVDVPATHGSDFQATLAQHGLAPLTARGIEVLQINVGRVCNQACHHCHVDAGPDRTETMSRATAELCVRVLGATDVPTVDITGGAPEMCPEFEFLVREAHRLGRHVIDRCNLTILTAKPYEGLPDFLADHGVEVVASLPHYRQLSTDRQRGAGVFDRSIEGLRRLNERGYGKPGSGLRLVLVTNPVGAFLPAGQASLEAEWKREMKRRFDVDFDQLFTITNMPISRYLEWLERSGKLAAYLQRLVDAFNPATTRELMCRTMLSVDWHGNLYDCDFNQMLGLRVDASVPQHLSEFDPHALASRPIVTDRHCFGCTAGAGSSCGGSLAE